MVRPSCCNKLSVRKGHWIEGEDPKLIAHVSKHGTSNLATNTKKTGLGRCGKSCRNRWSNRPDLKHESFTPQEEEMIINLHAAIGCRWPIIAQQLPGRTDNDVKNLWNTKLKKKLSEMGIDHVTHKPFSQIIADYGTIASLPKPTTRIAPLNPNFKNTFIHKPQHSPIPLSSPENISSNNINNYANINTQSLDLLTQLQAITLVIQSPNHPPRDFIQPQLNNENACSSSSSSSPCSTANEGWVPQSFSWRDFLLEEALPPQNGAPQVEHLVENVVPQVENEIKQTDHMKKEFHECSDTPVISSLKASAPSADNSSFVEAMLLDGEHDMFLEFPGLLEEPFFY